MSFVLEVDSVEYSNFLSAGVVLSMDTLAHEFFFEAVSEGTNYLPFTGGQECKVVIEGKTVTTGTLEVVRVDYGGRSHNIALQGRSKTGDVTDSSLEELELNPPISLQECINRVITQLGLNITVTDNSGIEPFDQNEDKIGPAVGENAFDFIMTLARKRQVLLNTDADGNIIITRSEAIETENSLISKVTDTGLNNILSATFNIDHTNRFNKYVVKSQLNTAALIFGGGATDLASIVNQGGSVSTDPVTDEDVRAGRNMVLRAEKSSSTEQARLRATWEANIRRARSQRYDAVVQGFTDNNGDLWTLNRLVNVVDEFCDINATKLINYIEFGIDARRGNVTRLGMVEPDTYQVSLEEPQPTEESGENLFQIDS